jgi:Uncharacterised protein family (UPF0261)
MSREVFLSASESIVAVLATLNTKGKETQFVADVLARAGATPWVVDLSLKPHDVAGADVATEMVTRYGMNEKVGPRTYAPPPQPFLTGTTANRVEGSERPNER